jgi:hypothetical protein
VIAITGIIYWRYERRKYVLLRLLRKAPDFRDHWEFRVWRSNLPKWQQHLVTENKELFLSELKNLKSNQLANVE